MSSSVNQLLIQQQLADQLLSDTKNVRTLIREFRRGFRDAGREQEADVSDLSSVYSTYISATYKPFFNVLSQYVRSQVQALNVAVGGSFECNFDTGNSNFIGDMMLYVAMPAIGLSDLTPVPGVQFPMVPGNGLIRYCNYPGARLFSSISLQINGKTVESYTPYNVMDYMFHELDISKREAFAACLGQQQLQYGKCSYTFDAYGEPIGNGVQMWMPFTNGAQTPMNTQPALSMTIPLLFNWARDNTVIMPTAYMNVRNRSVEFDLNPMSMIVSQYADMPLATVGSNFNFLSVAVYTRAIYMDEDVAALFMRKQKTMVRTWLTQTQLLNAPGTTTYSLDQSIKYPIECIYTKFIPSVNFIEATTTSGANVSTYDYWYVPAQVLANTMPISFIGQNVETGAIFQNGFVAQFNQLQPIVTSLDLSVQDVDLYTSAIDPVIVGNYAPFLESSIHRAAPFVGDYIFNFSQRFRGDFNRSAYGYLDFTNLANKQLQFTSTVITEANPVLLVLSVKFLNFISIDDSGNVVYTYPVTI